MTVCFSGALRFITAERFSSCAVIGPHSGIKGVKSDMSDTYIIEVGSQAAGIVVRDADGYRFFAAAHRFNAIDGQLFRNARAAERAAIRLASGDLKTAA